MRRIFLGMVALVLVSRCGGEVAGPPIPPSATDFPPPEAGAVPYDPAIGALGTVPGGVAYIGWWQMDAHFGSDGYTMDGFTLSPRACSPAFMEHARVIVAPFRLMITEVTNAAYARCVNEGACGAPQLGDDAVHFPNIRPPWDAPGEARKPVAVSWRQARAFCRHYGGDLPTPGQFARASDPDTDSPGIPSMIGLLQDCYAHPAESPECEHVGHPADAPQQGAPTLTNGGLLLDVGSFPQDTGPFGQQDLFANAAEWERAGVPAVVLDACTWPLYDHDVYPPPEQPPHGFTYFPPGTLSNGDVLPDYEATDGDLGTAITGFRCAFPVPDTGGGSP